MTIDPLSQITEKYQYSLERVPIELIDTSWVKTRQCTGAEPNFEGFLSSIRVEGQLQPVLIRRIQDGDVVTLSLIDGNRRLTACKKLHKEFIDAKVIEKCSDRDAMILQLVTNIQSESITKTQFRKQLERISNQLSEEELTALEAAVLIHKTEAYVKESMQISNLTPELQPLLDSGDLPISRARLLAKFPPSHQEAWYRKTKDLSFSEFAPVIRAALIKYRQETIHTPGISSESKIWVPQPKYRTKVSLIKALESPQIITSMLTANMTVEDGIREGILYALQMDAKTYAEREQKLLEAQQLDVAAKIKSEREKAKQRFSELKKELVKLEEQIKLGEDAEEEVSDFTG